MAQLYSRKRVSQLDFKRPYGLTPKLYNLLKRFCYALVLAVVPVASAFCTEGDRYQLIFDHLGVTEGLSQSWAITITQDTDGFIWVGTRDGLNRYDGRNFKVYRSVDTDSSTLNSSHVTSLMVDSKNRMWVGTVEGLNLYDPQKDNFRRVLLDGENAPGLVHINDITEGQDGTIWITASEGLFLYDTGKNGKVEEVFSPGNIRLTNKIKTVIEDSKKNLWIGAENGVIYLDFSKGNRIIQSHLKLPEIAGKLGSGLVNDLVEYPEGILWIATETGGLFRYDLSLDVFRNFNEDNGLISNHVRELMLNIQKDELWIGTRNGLNICNLATLNFQAFQHSIADPNSLSDNSIHSIYKDKDGTFWIGTFSSGLNLFSESFFKITTYQPKPDNKGLSNATVSCINEIGPDQLLIGTEGGGMNLYNTTTQQYTHFIHNADDGKSLPHNNVKCIFKDSDGIFWIGTSGGGVSVYDPVNHTYKKYTDKEIGIRSDVGWVYSIDQDQEGILWFGQFDSGLSWYDKNTGKYGRFDEYMDDSFHFAEIRKVFVDSGNRIWIGTDNGLFCYDKEKELFRKFYKNQTDRTSLSSNIVYSIYEDSHGIIWIGTLEGGLNKYIGSTDSFESYRVTDGLPGNNVFGILEDSEGNLWLSTNRGISKFNPSSKIFKNYTTKDGFLDTEYGYNAYFKSQKGELFFGGRKGMVSFYPERIKENRAVPPVFITEFKLFNRNVEIGDESGILKNQIGATREIVLNHNQNVFTLNFSILNFIKSSKNQFAYRLDGLEDDWNYVEIPSATYTNLQPGTYSFLAMGANNDGYWNHEPAVLKIVVKPAPWKTIWAYLIYTGILVAAVVTFIRYQRIKVGLEHDLKIREFENNRQRDLNYAKLKFFTDISHEIRTPLTLMMIPIENMISSYRSERSLYKQLLMVKNNADRLLRLINQLLDFRKREYGKVRLKAAEGNFVKFIKEISLAFQAQAKKRNISYHFRTDSEEVLLYYDRDEMEKVFFNLISNAFKYTPDSENIEIFITSQAEMPINAQESVPAVMIQIMDSGVGINADDVEKIFERYYEADHSGMNSLSTGIGLSLSKSIIKDHKGLITCQSTKGMGEAKNSTIFTVYLRYGSDHLEQEDIIRNFSDSEQINKYVEMLTPAEDEIPGAEGVADRHPSITILVVEDNDEIRSFLVNHLAAYYQVSEASNGREALGIAVEILPDLVVSDVVMPEMDGIQLCSELKNDERTSHIPIIILTARTTLIHKVEGIDSGADEYLIKPFNMELLKAKIRNLIESRELLRRKFSREITLQPENIVISDPDEKFLQRAKTLLEENVSNPDFNVNQFIREIGMSRPVLYRKIKAITNMSIFDFINNYRLNKAAMILKSGHFNISEIAFQVGFADPKYFSKAFRKKFGTTPTEYLSEMKEEHETIDD